MNRTSGQALVEFAGSAAMLTLIALGAGRILFSEWEKTRCSILVFEKTHAQLTHSPDPYPGSRARVSIQENGDALEGEAWCGSAHEKARFQLPSGFSR